MDKLLTAFLDAHGALQNWADVTSITAEMSLGGIFWAARGWPDIYSRQTVTLDPHCEHIVFAPFTAPDRMSVLDVGPERIAIATRDGRIIEERLNPRGSFPLPFMDRSTPWDAIQVAYFASAAVWNYLTTPFVFTHPVSKHKKSPPGERARKLGEGWPSSSLGPSPTITPIRSFITTMRSCSGAWTIRPTDGKPAGRTLRVRPQNLDGFIFPTRRRVLLHDAEGVANQAFVPITVDVSDVTVDRR